MGAPLAKEARPWRVDSSNTGRLEHERRADLQNPREHDQGGAQVVRTGPQGLSPDSPLVQRVVDVETQLHRACAPEIHPLRGTDVQLMGVGETEGADGLDIQLDRSNRLSSCKQHSPSLRSPIANVVE